jgi:DDE domain
MPDPNTPPTKQDGTVALSDRPTGADRPGGLDARNGAHRCRIYHGSERSLEALLRTAGHGEDALCLNATVPFGQVIDVLVSEKRDLAATRRFFARALEHGPSPTEVTTDHAAAYPRVLDELVPAACHVTEQYGNNPIEAVRHEVARNEWITRTGGRYRSTA